jgi:murein DD-endopeptidase MepM/ murein hydrolase activator NlpD
MMRRLLLIVLAMLLPQASAWSLPRHLPVPGGVAVLALASLDAGERPRVFFNDREQAVVRADGRWQALVGLPLETPLGRSEIVVRQGEQETRQVFAVRGRYYPAQRLRIPEARLVTPPPEVEQRIAAEQVRLAELKRQFSLAPTESDGRDGDGSMATSAFASGLKLPAAGRLSSRFGVRRVLNGEPRAPHAGLDVAIATGTPVAAAAAGRVLAVEDFYFTGGTVVIDHGQGLLTLYAHLSRIDVQPGQTLQRGEAIGASGASGRATGPHLHWVVVLGGTAVDPELFLPGK